MSHVTCVGRSCDHNDDVIVQGSEGSSGEAVWGECESGEGVEGGGGGEERGGEAQERET